MDFILPDDFDRLTEMPSDGRFWVQSAFRPADLSEDKQLHHLKTIRNALFSKETGVLSLPQFFEDLYWFVAQAGTLPATVQADIGDVVMAGVVQFTRLREGPDLQLLATCIKMLVLLLSEWLRRVPDFAHKKVRETMIKLVAYDLAMLWKGRSPESRFVCLVMLTMFPLISKGVNPTEQTAWLLSHASEDMWAGWKAKITQMLFANDTKDQGVLISTIIEVVKDKPDLAAGLLKEVADNLQLMDTQQADSDSMRKVSSFIEELGNKLPQLFISGLPLLIHLLDCESYVLRNGIVSAIKYFLKFLLRNEGEGVNEVQTALEKRNKLFDILEQRTRDKSAYSRAKALDALRELIQDDCMPIDRFMNTVKIAKERLMDVAAIVRKNAGKLLLMILFKDKFETNGDYKSVEELTNQIEETKAELERLKAEERGEGPKSPPSPEEMAVLRGRLAFNELYLSQYIELLTTLADCTATLHNLLQSKQITDIQTAIEALYLLQSKGVKQAVNATKRIVPLIWSKDDSVKHAVTFGFHGVYTNLEYIDLESAIGKLMLLYQDLTPGERYSLEDLFAELHRAKLVSGEFPKQFKKKFVEMPSAALAFFVRCTLAQDKDSFLAFYDKFYKAAIKAAPHWNILQEVLEAAQKCGPCGDKAENLVVQSAATLWDPTFPFNPSWFGCAEQCIRAVATLSSEPMEILRKLMIELTKPLLLDRWSEEDLAKCLFAAGEVCLKVLVAADKLKTVFQQKKNAEMSERKDNELEEISGIRSADLQTGLEALSTIQEHSIIHRNMLSLYTPLIQHLMSNIHSVKSPLTQQAALLAFSKFLCTSQAFCQANLPLLFAVIENQSLHPSLRCNGIVALGDLVQRFPLTIEPHSDRFFSKLRDPDTGVKRKAMLVLTHLVLNDMLKLKGQASDVLFCLLDPEVRNLTSLFLEELYKKDATALFNVLPDALSKLIPSQELTYDQFKLIIDKVFAYVERERWMENLIDKLCQRMLSVKEGAIQLRISYCLNKLVSTEKTLKKLLENIAIWQAVVLQSAEVKGLFEDMRTKTAKGWKSDSRALLEEFDGRLQGVVEERKHKAPRRR